MMHVSRDLVRMLKPFRRTIALMKRKSKKEELKKKLKLKPFFPGYIHRQWYNLESNHINELRSNLTRNVNL